MRNLVTRYSRLLTVVLIACMILTFSIWVGTNIVWEAKEAAKDKLKTLTRIDNLTFPYVYDPVPLPLEIDVRDKSETDWKEVHDYAVKQGELRAIQSKNSSSWLDDNFAATSYETVVTPFLVNKPVDEGFFKTKPKSAEELGKLFGFRLWFAHDDRVEGKLYTLGRLAIPAVIGSLVSLGLTVGKKTIGVSFEDNGDLSFKDVITNEKMSLEDGVSGTWWTSGQNWFFELALENSQPNNVDLSAVIGRKGKDGLSGYAIGTRSSLPLFKDISSYETVLDAFLGSSYSMDKRKHWLAIRRGWKDERGRIAGIRLTWLLIPLSRFYPYFDGIKPCLDHSPDKDNSKCPGSDLAKDDPEWEAGTYLIWKEGKYILRTLRKFEGREDGRVGVLAEELLRAPRGFVLAVSVIILLGSLTYYVSKWLGETNKELNDTSEKLEQSNVDLKQANRDLDNVNERLGETNKELNNANKKLESFVSNFRHQGSNLLEELLALAGEDGSTEIKEKAEDIRKILRDTINIHAYERLVSDSIKKADDRFSLSCAVNKRVEFYRKTEKNIAFNDNAKRQGFRLFLAARSGESGSKSHYFDQVIDAIVNNAVQRRNENSTITLSLDAKPVDKPSCAVFKVSNFGPVPDLTGIETEDLFRHTYTRPPDPEKSLIPTSRGDENNHGGSGLYIVSQIVEGYKGNRKLEILEGDKGVEVTVELPVEFENH